MGRCWGHVRKDIFDYIISELGSLERMDEQIRELMGEIAGEKSGQRGTGNGWPFTPFG